MGAGYWGQFDLAGEVWEWNLDWYAPYVDPCIDCAYLPTTAPSRVIRGGYFHVDLGGAAYLLSSNRLFWAHVVATLRVRRRITHESGTHKIEWVARSLQIRVVLGAFLRRVRGLALRMAERAEEPMRTVTLPVPVVGGLVRDAVRLRDELIAENTLLR
jgi:hypothetical protein